MVPKLAVAVPVMALPWQSTGAPAADTTDVSVVVLLDDVGIDFASGDHDTSDEEDAPQTSTTGAYLLTTSEPLRPLSCRSHERIAHVSSIAAQSHNRDVPTPPPDNVSA